MDFLFVNPEHIYNSSSLKVIAVLLSLNTFIFLFILYYICKNYKKISLSPVKPDSNKVSRKHSYVLLIIVLIGLILRVIGLGAEDLEEFKKNYQGGEAVVALGKIKDPRVPTKK